MVITSRTGATAPRRRSPTGAHLEHRLGPVELEQLAMHATIQGCDIVCPSPIRTAPSRYARRRWSSEAGTARAAPRPSREHPLVVDPAPAQLALHHARRSRSVDVVPESSGSCTVTFPRPRVTIPARSSVARKRLALSREVPARWRSPPGWIGSARPPGVRRRPGARSSAPAARSPPGRPPSGRTAGAAARSSAHALGEVGEQLEAPDPG